MPTWTFTDQGGRVEVIEADRIEADGTGWSWWTARRGAKTGIGRRWRGDAR